MIPNHHLTRIDTIVDVDSEKWTAAKKHLENQCTIYFTDTGGQLEFQEVLPAIISGPSIFLLVFINLVLCTREVMSKFIRHRLASALLLSEASIQETR